MSRSESPMSSLTRLLQNQNDQKQQQRSNLALKTSETYHEELDLTNAVSIEGVEVPGYREQSIDGTLNSPPIYSRSGNHTQSISINSNSYTQRSPIAINASSHSTAPPIRAPLGTSIHRQPSHSNFHSYNNSYSGRNDGILSTSIPYSVPNSNNSQNNNSHNSDISGSAPRYSGLPSNISVIESVNITSPSVTSTSDIEPRFIISKQKVAAVQLANSLSKSSTNLQSSSNGMFSRSKKNSQMDLGSFYNNHNYASSSQVPIQSFSSSNPKNTEVFSGSPSSESSLESSFSKSKHSSMADLKRFFKKTPSSPKNANNYAMSPITSQFSIGSVSTRERSGSMSSSYNNNISAYTTPQNLPFSKRYSKSIEALGAGAGGSVKLVKRLTDSKTFAVKEFRARVSSETRREYAKKITSEYCIGSTLRHQNIIETIEIAYENDRLLQVLEYCDYDLFAIVMSNRMSDNEIDCCFRQILNGIQYVHHMGLAHRDLKLDNCVINSQGIVKIIDFGSAVVFSYPFNKTLIEASGIVGSDPYLSPETLVFSKYDPRPVDIWSAAMIYCCMVLKKFPWKIPKLSDNSFKLFCTGRDSDSLSNLLTRTPSIVDKEEVKQKPVPSAFSNLSKALAKPLKDIEDEADNTSETSSSSDPSAVTVSNSVEKVEEGISETATPQESVTVEQEPQKDEESGENHTSQLVGANRLLKALPAHVRPVIGRMVELAPACRASIDEVVNDSWVQSIEFCCLEERVDGSGMSTFIVHNAHNHEHTQVDQSEAHIAALERKKQNAKK
ncbi:hypothetical protein WICMUC_002219 [Wickerhamomyces mucosus]|uniref:non-specific serine/threonine protein kinase n=1 Tax=Wickerhamomyces mucosus TaxID=1378264 RepID=A0A9P8PPJ2_9ASCO|nr:hypothetical protein WICMUC_002219 [Wickerhamomyces mucosus]